MKWQVVFTKQAQKDAKKLSSAGLRPKAEALIELLTQNPYVKQITSKLDSVYEESDSSLDSPVAGLQSRSIQDENW